MSHIDIQIQALKTELAELREELRWAEDDHDHEREAELTDLIEEIEEEINELRGDEFDDEEEDELEDFDEE